MEIASGMRLRRILCLLLLLGPAVALFSQSSVWEVRGKTGRLFLGGTVHVLRTEDYPLPEEFEYAYKTAQTVVFETDLKALQDGQTAALIMERGFYGQGDITDFLSSDTLEELKAVLQSYSVPLEAVKQMKPGLLSSTLTMLQLQGMGFAPEGVDMHFYGRAEADGKSIRDLEPIERQIALITDMGEGAEDDFIRYTLDDLENNAQNLEGLIEDWKAGEHQAMDESIAEMKERFPGLHDDLLTDRNQRWLPQLEEYLKSSETELVLFGALHLHGEEGILNLLRKKGYKTKQLVLNK